VNTAAKAQALGGPELVLEAPDLELWRGDARVVLDLLPAASVHAIVTSPPFWRQREYDAGDGELGLETSPLEWARELAGVFDRAARVLRADGSLWVEVGERYVDAELVDAPALLVDALRRHGWRYRERIVWHKTNAQPDSARDRFTLAHSYALHLVRGRRYYANVGELDEPVADDTPARARRASRYRNDREARAAAQYKAPNPTGRDDGLRTARSVWPIPTGNESSGLCRRCGAHWLEYAPEKHCGEYVVAHRATFTPELVARLVRVSTPAQVPPATVLDPFAGVGTLGRVARELGRRAVLVELSPEYVELARRNLAQQSITAELAR
jgi:DNA modification methylase